MPFNLHNEPQTCSYIQEEEPLLEIRIEEIQAMIAQKKNYIPKVNNFMANLDKYFNFVKLTY